MVMIESFFCFIPTSTLFLFFLLLSYIIGIFIHATFVLFLMANLFWRLKFIWNEKCQRWNAHEGQEQEPSKEKDECFVSQQDCKSSDSTAHKNFHISWLCVKFSLCFFEPSPKVRNHFLDFFFYADILRRFWMIIFLLICHDFHLMATLYHEFVEMRRRQKEKAPGIIPRATL